MALYFYFNETIGDLVYSDQATYGVDGYASLGEQTNMNPSANTDWVFDSKRKSIKTVTKDPTLAGMIEGLTSMSTMFSGCSSLTSLDLSGFDTSQMAEMGFMFNGCSSLASLDLSGFDTSKVTVMNSLFSGCSSLASLDLSGFDTSKVTLVVGMFDRCSNLRLITVGDSMSNALSQLPADQYYPASGGSPVAKASITAGTWVRDEADLSLVATLVETAQAAMALRRKLTSLAKRVAKLESGA